MDRAAPSLQAKSMTLKEDLQAAVARILRDQWTSRPGRIVPEPEDLELGNDAVTLDATVLYADLSGSTNLVDTEVARKAAEFYKSYMVCAARIIKDAGGSITAYDGDRIMGIFIGDSKNSTAAKTALQINWARIHLMNPAIKKQYGPDAYQLKHVIGVDRSSLLACRIGVRNDNDLVWVGRAANYAAKLSSISEENTTFITGEVFDAMNDGSKYGDDPPRLMWTERRWTPMGGKRIYSSMWWWSL
jgi:class 3 adenylate cyclase